MTVAASGEGENQTPRKEIKRLVMAELHHSHRMTRARIQTIAAEVFERYGTHPKGRTFQFNRLYNELREQDGVIEEFGTLLYLPRPYMRSTDQPIAALFWRVIARGQCSRIELASIAPEHLVDNLIAGQWVQETLGIVEPTFVGVYLGELGYQNDFSDEMLAQVLRPYSDLTRATPRSIAQWLIALIPGVFVDEEQLKQRVQAIVHAPKEQHMSIDRGDEEWELSHIGPTDKLIIGHLIAQLLAFETPVWLPFSVFAQPLFGAGWGEPETHPDFVRMLEFLEAKGLIETRRVDGTFTGEIRLRTWPVGKEYTGTHLVLLVVGTNPATGEPQPETVTFPYGTVIIAMEKNA